MADSNRRKFPLTNIGTVTLLMILIILCMVIFALLSLSTARSDQQAAKRLAAHTTDYYTACNKAEEQLAAIDSALQAFYAASSDLTAYQQHLHDYITDHPELLLGETGNAMTLSWQTPLNDTQALSVALDILYPAASTDSASQTFYRITSWQIISTAQWEGDNSVTLMGE